MTKRLMIIHVIITYYDLFAALLFL